MPDVRIAMWSGPRNISTAMMRAWENRADCTVDDEPLYASYLQATGLDHPGREDILGAQPTDWRVVLERLVHGPLPDGTTVSYQKHMTHHVLPGIDRSAFEGLHHAFLIREPAAVVLSYAKVRGEPTLEDLGFPQQVELFERFGGPVVDARDVLERPEPVLRALCAALDVPYDPAMLSWPAGRRASDGIWAPHWYDRVWGSTGFAAHEPLREPVPAHLHDLLDRCQPFYDALAPYRMSAPT